MVYMSHSPNSFKGGIWGIVKGITIGVIKRDTRILDYSSYSFWCGPGIEFGFAAGAGP